MNYQKLVTATATFLLGVSFSGVVLSAAVNLVPNGDFQAGKQQFTSGYTFNPAGNATEGEYTIRTDPFPWNPSFVSIGDHTSGSGMMMVANGSPVSGEIVWKSQSIAVAAATNYFFEAFVNNVCCQTFTFGPGSESILEFALSLNGGPAISLATITTDLSLAGTWEGLSTQFLANAAGTVELSLINRNTNRLGNDFAVDDVYFGIVSTVNPPFGVPEPASLVLLGIGLAALSFSRRQRESRPILGTRTTPRLPMTPT